jgi:hypothetical protein
MSELLQIGLRDLRPDIRRQRVIIEGLTETLVEPAQIRDYLTILADVTGMEIVNGPYTCQAHGYGYAGWVNWVTSGAHFYSYPRSRKLPEGFTTKRLDLPALFSVDMYTCKPFEVDDAVAFTGDYFSALDLVAMELNPHNP